MRVGVAGVRLGGEDRREVWTAFGIGNSEDLITGRQAGRVTDRDEEVMTPSVILDVESSRARSTTCRAAFGLATRTVVAHHGPHPATRPEPLGPRWSARHQEPLVLGGHERSRSASRDRKSQAIHPYDLRRQSSTGGLRLSSR